MYAGLGVPEVWTWKTGAGRCEVRRLVEGHYELRTDSVALSGIDLALVAKFVRPGESHTALVKAYRAALPR